MAAKIKASKEINLTTNKTASSVAKWINGVNKSLMNELRKSDIAVFKEIAASKDITGAFFLSYGYFVGVLSANALLTLRRIFHDVLCGRIAEETINAMIRSGTNYPGCWNFFKVKTIIAAIASIAVIDDKPTMAMVVPGDNGEDNLKPVMPFEEYNPNRLYQYAVAVESATIAVIETEVANVIPSSLRTVSSMKLNERYGNEFHEVVTMAGVQFPTNVPDDMDAAADAVFGVIKKPIIAYTTALLNESGVNLKLIREVFKRSEDKLIYNVDTSTGKMATGFVHPWVKIDYIVYDKGDPMTRPTFSASMSDMNSIFGENPSDSCKGRIGTAFQRFVGALIPYMLGIASKDPTILVEKRAILFETMQAETPAAVTED